MTLQIRRLDRDSLVEWATVVHRTFFSAEAPEQWAQSHAEHLDFGRAQAAYDGKQMVGTFRSFATELTVPGGCTVTADAISAVTVAATHRRQGLLTRMMRADLDAARERGEPVAILIAAEFPIYGRFGFGPATEHVQLEVATATARFTRPGEGRVGYVDPAELRSIAPAVYDRHRFASPGEITRDALRWDVVLGLVANPEVPPHQRHHVVVRDADDVPVGYVVFHVKDAWEGRVSRVRLHVDELVAATPAAYARLWRFVCEVDWVTTVTAGDRSVGEPLPWLLADGRAVQQAHRADFLWARPLDVPAALAARRYLTPGQVVLEVVDPGGYAAGRFRLDGGPEGAQCRSTTAGADVTLDAAALGAAYLGGVALADLARAGRVVEERPGALAVADAMLRSAVTPWSATWF